MWPRLCLLSLHFGLFEWSGWDGSLLAFSECTKTLYCLLDSSGSRLAVISNSVTGVVFMAPRMISGPKFWTLSSLLLLVLEAIIHDVKAYSAIGSTVPVYICLRIFLLAP